MSKLLRVLIRLFAALFFLCGAAFLPFYVWAPHGPNPVLGWAIYLCSVLIPWAIACSLLQVAKR